MLLILGVDFKTALDIHVLNEDTRIPHYATSMKSVIFPAAAYAIGLFW